MTLQHQLTATSYHQVKALQNLYAIYVEMLLIELLDAGCAASSKVIQHTEVGGPSDNVVKQETNSTRGFPFR